MKKNFIKTTSSPLLYLFATKKTVRSRSDIQIGEERREKLLQAIDEILWMDWDPIGVRSIAPGARDEYKDYVPEIAMLKLNNANVEKITEALYDLEKSFGAFGEEDEERCRRVAGKIARL